MADHQGKLGDRISGDLSTSVFEGLQHEKNRQHVIGIIKDYTDHVDFMEKVKKYAGEEMDSRLFISSKFWLTTIGAAVISGAVAVIVSKIK